MCVKWVADWETAAKDITAFKAVRRSGKHYQSSVSVQSRDTQQKAGTRGTIIEYRLGRYAEGDDPGIYCFETPAMAMEQHDEEGICVVEVKIPKGTRIRRGRAVIEDVKGRALELLTINAMRIKVVRELDEKTVKKALWPRAQPINPQYVHDTPIWNYFTASTTTMTVCWASVTTD